MTELRVRVDALRTAAPAYDGVVALAASGAAGLAAPAPGGGPVDAAVAEVLAALHEASGRLEDSHRHVSAALAWAADELKDRFGNLWVAGPSRRAGDPLEWDVQLSKAGQAVWGRWSRDGRHLNVSPSGEVTHR